VVYCVCTLQYRKARARAKHTNGGVCSRSWRRRRVVGACGGSRAYGVFAKTRTRARPLVVCLSVNYTRTQILVPSRRSPLTRVHRVCRCVVRYYHHHHHHHHHNRHRHRYRHSNTTIGHILCYMCALALLVQQTDVQSDDCPNRRHII
jgi:hypothetical protein